MTRKEVINALEAARNKLLTEKNKEEFKGWTRTIQYHFTDTDDVWHFKVQNGIPSEWIHSEAENPDIVFKWTEDTFLGIMSGTINGMKTFMAGKVKVKASMKDISKMQKLM